jgi:hypothetical protein
MRALLLLALVFLSGCSSTPQLTGPRFEAVERPNPGLARLYLFRPGFTEQLAKESPWVAVADTQIVQLAHEGFTSITLRPGKYEIAIRPAPGQSDLWKVSAEITAEPDKTYFVAVWMDQSGFAAPSMFFVPVGGFPVPIRTNSFRTIQRASAARMELVSQEQAVPVLQDLRYLAPANSAAPR